MTTDPTKPVSLQHDACGALLRIELPTRTPTRHTVRCALGMGHQNMPHRAADGTQWDTATPATPHADRVYLRPSDMERVAELERLAAPSEDGALNLGPIIERHRAAAGTPGLHHPDILPLVREVMKLRRPKPPAGPDATIRSAVDGIERQIEGMTAVFAELREAVDSGQLNAVRAVLRESGLGYAPPADDVHDLVGALEAKREHAANCEAAISRIAELARQAVASGGLLDPAKFGEVLGGIVAECERGDR